MQPGPYRRDNILATVKDERIGAFRRVADAARQVKDAGSLREQEHLTGKLREATKQLRETVQKKSP